MIQVIINGEVKNAKILASSQISISKTLGETWTADLSSVSLDGETQTLTGNGALQQFTLDRIPVNIPGVTIASVAQTVGLYGIDTGKDWYWELGTKNLYQDPLGTPITGGIDVDLGTWYPSVGQPLLIKCSHNTEYQITGDGVASSWVLPQTATSILSLVANGILPQTFGIYGVDSGKQYYLDLGTNTLIRDAGALPNLDTIDLGFDYWVTVFGGIIRSVTRRKPDANSSALFCDIAATDYNYILERRLAGVKEYTATTDNAIVDDLNTRCLTDEGITTDTVTAVDIASFRVAYDTVAGALSELGKLSLKRFWVDSEKVLRFLTPATSAAPFSIASGADNISSLAVTETDEDYCNVVVVKSQQTIRDSQTESFTGDGAATSFELAYPVASEPKISVNGTPKMVGVVDVDTGRDWYWQQGSKTIRQDADGTVLSSSDTLTVEYSGISVEYITAEATGEIAARAAIEGSSGRYERLFEIDRLLTKADAQATADAILADRSTVPLKAAYTTNDYLEPEAKNLQPGQYQSMRLDGWAAQQDDYLVRSIRMSTMGTVDDSDHQFGYEVEMFHGSVTKTLLQWFRDLAGGGATAGGSAGATDGDVEYFYGGAGGCDVVVEGNDVLPFWPHVHNDGSLFDMSVGCKVTPTSDLVFDVKVWSEGESPSSILTAGSITIPAGTTKVLFFNDFSARGLALKRGDRFRADVTSNGSAQGLNLKMAARQRNAETSGLRFDGSGETTTGLMAVI